MRRHIGRPGLAETALFRYWYVVEELDGGESPTDALFDDWQLLLTLLLWVATCAWALWPGKG